MKKINGKEHPLKRIDEKILGAQCLVEMVGSELIDLYGKNPKIEKSYKNLYEAAKLLKESKSNLPIDI
jgi:hypothetical protein|tara:strand:+ start:106 stop:309 length:204 start_codon:yes stop_codon:yes gene_type:complete